MRFMFVFVLCFLLLWHRKVFLLWRKVFIEILGVCCFFPASLTPNYNVIKITQNITKKISIVLNYEFFLWWIFYVRIWFTVFAFACLGFQRLQFRPEAHCFDDCHASSMTFVLSMRLLQGYIASHIHTFHLKTI